MTNIFSSAREGRVMTYVCYRCSNQVKLNIDMPGQFFRCPYCGSHIFIKLRPPFIKKIKGY